MSERIEKVKAAVQEKVGGLAKHVESTPVREIFQGKVIWEGVVETFDLASNPIVKRCYAWSYKENGEIQYVTVNRTVEINSPEMAVKFYIASQIER